MTDNPQSNGLQKIEPLFDSTPIGKRDSNPLAEEAYRLSQLNALKTVSVHGDNQLLAIDRACSGVQRSCLKLIEKLAGHKIESKDLDEGLIEIGTPPKLGKLVRTNEFDPKYEKRLARNTEILALQDKIDSGEIAYAYSAPTVTSIQADINALDNDLNSVEQLLKPNSAHSGLNVLQGHVIEGFNDGIVQLCEDAKEERDYLEGAAQVKSIDKELASDLVRSAAGIYHYLQDVRNKSFEAVAREHQDWKIEPGDGQLERLRLSINDRLETLTNIATETEDYVFRMYPKDRIKENTKSIKETVQKALDEIVQYEMLIDAKELEGFHIRRIHLKTDLALNHVKPFLIRTNQLLHESQSIDSLDQCLSEIGNFKDTKLPSYEKLIFGEERIKLLTDRLGPIDKPTIVQFHAKWAKASESAKNRCAEVQKQYGDRINVLSVDFESGENLSQLVMLSSLPLTVFLDVEGVNELAGEYYLHGFNSLEFDRQLRKILSR